MMMMSSRSSSLFELFFVVIPMILMIIISNNNPSSSCDCRVLEELDDEGDDAMVNVTLNYQSFCEGCARYISKDLGNLYTNLELMSIVNLNLLPFGNAKVVNTTVECQNGPDECYLNTIEACALNEWRLEKSFPFIKCIENGLLEKNGDVHDLKYLWTSCCKELDLDADPISNCYESGHGIQLLLSYGNESNAQVPRHFFVPWVTVNTVPLGFDIFELSRYVCDAYKGHKKLQACSSKNMHLSATSSNEEFNSTQAVCYADNV